MPPHHPRQFSLLSACAVLALACSPGNSNPACSDQARRNIGALILAHHARYPEMQIADAFKLLQQATLGSEHAVRDSTVPMRWMDREWSALGEGPAEPLVDSLGVGGAFARVHLRPWRTTGKPPADLVNAFVATARESKPDTAALGCALAELETLAREGKVPWDADSVALQAQQWQAKRYPAVDHSLEYKSRYRPAYRVVARSLLPALLAPAQ